MIIDKKLLYINNDPRNYNQESSTDVNLFKYSLEALIESNEIIINKLKEETCITEGKIFDFYGILKSIIGAFVNIIQKIVGKFLSLFVFLAGQGKAFDLESKAFADKIKNYYGEFRMDGIFRYTNLDDGTFPDSSLSSHFSDSLNKFIDNFNSAVDSSTIASEVAEKLGTTSPIEEAKSNFRCYLLGINDNVFISDEIFGRECFKVFRNGAERPYNNAIFDGKGVYKNIYLPYLDNKKLQSKAKKESKLIQDACREAKNKLKKFTPNISKFSSEEYTEVLNLFNNMQRNVCTLFDYECKDVITIYGAKLQAYKDSYKQSRRIIMKCMQEIAQKAPFGDKREGEW